jgi:hypothetical protein
MSGSLRGTISQLASEFAAGILGAIRGSSLEAILGETAGAARRRPGRPRKNPLDGAESPVAETPRRGRGGRLRRSAKALSRVVDQIASLLASHTKGLRAEQIRADLRLSAKELPRPIALALEGKRITKTGEKRATTYFAGGGGAGSRKAARPAKPAKSARPARRRAKKARSRSQTKPPRKLRRAKKR